MASLVFAVAVVLFTASIPAFAACDSEQQNTKAAAISTLISPSALPTETPESKAIASENNALFMASPSDEVCAKLDELLVRAQELPKQ